jgi:hypothetical protein
MFLLRKIAHAKALEAQRKHRAGFAIVPDASHEMSRP